MYLWSTLYDVIINDQEVLKVFNHPRIDLLEKKEIIKKTFENYVSNNDATYLADGTETAKCTQQASKYSRQ